MPDQAATPEPVDQLLHSTRVRDVLKSRTQRLARTRHRFQDRALDWLTSPAVHNLDPATSAGNLDPPVLLHAGNGSKSYPLHPAAQICDLIHVKFAH